MRQRVVNAVDFASPESTTAGIQEAIDSLPASGGAVCLPPGRYALRRSIELRSQVTLRGEGPATILTRPRQVIVLPIVRRTDGSRTTIYVKGAGDLRVGDEIYLGDDESHGWWASHCIVREIRPGSKGSPGSLGLDILHGQRKHQFRPERHARVVNVTMRHWPGDGIGLQGGRGAFVTGCLVENCAGHGYHPGTGITQSIWADNIARKNTRDGLFFCLRVTHSTVRGNVLVDNGGHGIGGLSDPDQYNVVIGNVCAGNGRHGIDADRAVGAIIQGNLCRNNSRSARGQFAGIHLAGHRDCVVTGNICTDDQRRPTQCSGLVERDPAGPNVIGQNQLFARN